MTRRALITGISGFVGGFLAEHLLDAGDMVLGCSPDGRWTEASPTGLRDRVELLAWELLAGDLLAWDRAERDGPGEEVRGRIERFQPDVIYHLAALSVPADCGRLRPTPEAEAINVGGTRRVVDLAASLPSRPRVLLTSSSHVYAPVSPEAPHVAENAPLGPLGGYGRTKRAAEEEVRRAVEEGRCEAVVARAFQHTGPRQSPRMMLPQWARQLAQDSHEPIEVYTRDAWIDLTDVRDVVRAYRLLVEHGRSGEVYNVGSATSRRSGDLLEQLRAMAGAQRSIVELHPGRKQDPIADITRLVGRTGWRAEIPLEQTLSDTLAYWRGGGSGSLPVGEGFRA
jgi:GDP-4-dehydro-6-deoxy-D-mannose reductase